MHHNALQILPPMLFQSLGQVYQGFPKLFQQDALCQAALIARFFFCSSLVIIAPMEEKYQKRIEAVKRYYSGERANYIYKSLGKPKQWLYFWLKRYNPKDEN